MSATAAANCRPARSGAARSRFARGDEEGCDGHRPHGADLHEDAPTRVRDSAPRPAARSKDSHGRFVTRGRSAVATVRGTPVAHPGDVRRHPGEGPARASSRCATPASSHRPQCTRVRVISPVRDEPGVAPRKRAPRDPATPGGAGRRRGRGPRSSRASVARCARREARSPRARFAFARTRPFRSYFPLRHVARPTSVVGSRSTTRDRRARAIAIRPLAGTRR